MGKGAFSGVGKTGASPYRAPVDEKAIRRTPCSRMASRTFWVAMMFCSTSFRG